MFRKNDTSSPVLDRRTWLKWTAGAASAGILIGGLDELFGQNTTPSLYHPLGGAGRLALAFGAEWVWGQCGGKNKIHCGVDLACAAGTAIYAAYDGTVKAQFEDAGWKGCLVIEHRTPGGVVFTTTYWHVKTDRSWAQVKRGQKIGTVADLAGKSINHLHFGLRQAAYSEVAKRGALPVKAGCGDPAFPEKFVRPL